MSNPQQPQPIILLTGAGGTGKTTLANALANRYHLPFLKSSSREVQKVFGVEKEDDQAELTKQEAAELQMAIAQRYWDDSRHAFESGEGYVSDRTIADHFTYRSLRGFADLDGEELNWYSENILQQLTEGNALVVYCPVGLFEPPDDGMRTTNPVQRLLFDLFVRGVLDAHRDRINLLPLFVTDIDSRMQHIHSAMLNCGLVEPSGRDDEQLLVRAS